VTWGRACASLVSPARVSVRRSRTGEHPISTDAPTTTRFVFIDTEATGLDIERHELTEVAWIVRFEDGREEERRYFPDHTLDGADAKALELTHYEGRIASQSRTPMAEWLGQFLEDAQDAVLVGAVPDFDARHLAKACRKLGLAPTWDHHLLDVETLALPLIAAGPEPPRSLAKTCQALGVPHDEDQAHGALYDARQAMRVFDAVWDLVGDLRTRAAPLPPPVPRPERSGGEATEEPTSGTGGTDRDEGGAVTAAGNGQTGPAPSDSDERTT
jgi:DNA polymerase III epsilon subunit-like protein